MDLNEKEKQRSGVVSASAWLKLSSSSRKIVPKGERTDKWDTSS